MSESSARTWLVCLEVRVERIAIDDSGLLTAENRFLTALRATHKLGTVVQVFPSGRTSIKCQEAAGTAYAAQRHVLARVRRIAAQAIPERRIAIPVIQVSPHDYRPLPQLAGLAEAASILGVTPQRVHQLMATSAFPAPKFALRMGPVFVEDEIIAYRNSRRARGGRPTSSALGD